LAEGGFDFEQLRVIFGIDDGRPGLEIVCKDEFAVHIPGHCLGSVLREGEKMGLVKHVPSRARV
jgi:hypothetical protein